ncbi:MAG TPA: DNA repair protein RecN [Vicinamibacterales bacterium]|nr:DNA repair protein RecN [Vicinamibacterales bacterium]
MLRLLRIRNLAVIEAVEVEFEPGFNVLTGETGAGKSIVVEAVGLLLGARASVDLVRTGEHQATIEAIFEDPQGTEFIVRREVSSQGRSRSFINGDLATATALRDLSQRLVEIHGQNEHQILLDPLSHLPLLDGHADLGTLAERVTSAWRTMRALREQLDRSRMDGREKAARLELIAFQLNEIEKAAPKVGEDEELAAAKQVLANAERVQRICHESYATLYDSDQAVLAGLGSIWKRVGELAAIDPHFAAYMDARDGIKSQLEDLAHFLRRYADGIDASPARLQQVEDRLALLERVKRKHGPSLEDVIERGRTLQHERDMLMQSDAKADDIEHALVSAKSAYLKLAEELSALRRGASTRFSNQLEALLAELAMAQTRFAVRFNETALPEDAWSERGIDQAEFFVSPNPGEDLRPLARIVSGGELSRIMLALKTMAVDESAGKTLVFDEVDAGIGGRVADVVGVKLRGLGERFQVLCITHLPQIAARAATQFRIDKTVRGQRTVTSVQRLDDHGRIEEVARMIGGASVSEPVKASARELLAASRDGGPKPAISSQAKGKQKAKGESETSRRP